MKFFRMLMPMAACMLLSYPADGQYREPLVQDLYDSEVVARMKEDVSFLSSADLDGRGAGTDGEREAALYVTARLSELGVDILSGDEGDLFGIKRDNGDTLRSRNVAGLIQGYDKSLKDHYIVIGARLDNIGSRDVTVNGEVRHQYFPGANGNGSGLAVLLELARLLQSNKVLLRRSVLLCAFGASQEGNAGSWYFLNRSFKPSDRIDGMINLDMLGTLSRGFYAYCASDLNMGAIVDDLSKTLQPVRPELVSIEPVGSDHRTFQANGIPSIMFTTGMYPEYNSESDRIGEVDFAGLERETEYIYHFALELCNFERKRYEVSPEGVVAYSDCDWKPSFLGSTDLSLFMKRWVYVYLRYPEQAVEEGIQGKVLVDFVVDASGKVRDVKVARGVDPLLDDEAVRVISASPDWKPGRVRGRKVSTALSLYVEFRLQKKKHR